MSTTTQEHSHFPSAMNLQDLVDMRYAIPEECATTLPKSNAHRALPARATQPPQPVIPTDKIAQINYEDAMLEKMESLLKTNALTDVTLIVGEEKIPLKAHKLILALASPVFTAMFYGDLANNTGTTSNSLDTQGSNQQQALILPASQQQLATSHHNLSTTEEPTQASATSPPPPPQIWHPSSVIEILDCSPDPMKAFLRYIYTNGSAFSTSVDDALSMLYIARKYAVRALEDKCVVTLSSSITAENLFDILYAANFYSITSLDLLCWEFIEDNPIEVLNTHLEYLTHDTLQSVLKNDKLNCKEVELFTVLMMWAETECAKMGLDTSPDNIRKFVSAELKLIRFPIMSGTEFADTVVPTGVLNVEQVAKIFTAINTSDERKKMQEQQDPNVPSRSSVSLSGMEFSTKKRCPNVKPAGDAQSPGATSAEDESNGLNRPPMFTFMAELRDHRGEQSHSEVQSHQQSVNNIGVNNVNHPMQMVATPVMAAGAMNNAIHLANNDVVGVVDYGLPGIVGLVPLTVPSGNSSQSGAGESRGRTRPRQARRSRRRGESQQ